MLCVGAAGAVMVDAVMAGAVIIGPEIVDAVMDGAVIFWGCHG